MALTHTLPSEDHMSSVHNFTQKGLPKCARLRRTMLPSTSSWYMDSDSESGEDADAAGDDDDSEFEDLGELSEEEEDVLGKKRPRNVPKSSKSPAVYGLASSVERVGCLPQTAAEFALASLETTPVAAGIVATTTLDAAGTEREIAEVLAKDRDQPHPSSPVRVDTQGVVAAVAPASPPTVDSQVEQERSDHNPQQQQQPLSLTNEMQRQHTATLARKKWIPVPQEAGKRSGDSDSRPKSFVCMECGKGFSKACKLTRHATMHTGEKPFACPEKGCSKAFATKDKLRRHVVTHARRKAGLSTSGSNNARREADQRMEAKRVALTLADTKGGGVMPSTMVTTLMEKETAMGTTSGNGKEAGEDAVGWKNACVQCGRTFLDKYHLRRHMKAIHEAPRMYKCDMEVVDDSEDIEGAVSGSSNIVGGVCDGGIGMVVDSIGERREDADGVGNAREASEEVPVSMMPKIQGRKVCGAAFVKKWQLREHLFEVHGATKFNCRQLRCPHPGCGRVFDRASKLEAHQKCHTARFRCEFEGCGKAFVLVSGLNRHLKEEHPYRCTECNLFFEREDKLQEHMGTHQRAGDGGFVRPYVCTAPGCGKAFTAKRNLNAHRRTQHTEGGRKRFKCEVAGCNMAFAHRHTLVKHVKREHPGVAVPSSTSVIASKGVGGQDA